MTDPPPPLAQSDFSPPAGEAPPGTTPIFPAAGAPSSRLDGSVASIDYPLRRVNSSMDPVVADDVIASRRQKIRSLVLPNCKPTAYSRDRRGSQTALNADQVERFRVPSQFSVVPADTVTAPALAAYEAYLASSDFPDALFADDGPINALVDAANALAGGPAPSGEAGVSHFLQVALFLILDLILSRFRPDQHERCWRFVGIGRTGKADWGLYLDGVLVFILKLKPHIVGPNPTLVFQN